MCTYNTPFNTIGVGDPVPYGMNSLGSGDRFDLGPKFKSEYSSRGRSYSQYNYKPAKMTFKPPKQMSIPGIHKMTSPPKTLPLPRISGMPFMKKPAISPGKVSGLKPKPLLVMATKRKKKK